MHHYNVRNNTLAQISYNIGITKCTIFSIKKYLNTYFYIELICHICISNERTNKKEPVLEVKC